MKAIPNGARATVRVLLLSSRDRILLLQAKDSSGHKWWMTPGGGVAEGESFEAYRNLLETNTSLPATGKLKGTAKRTPT